MFREMLKYKFVKANISLETYPEISSGVNPDSSRHMNMLVGGARVCDDRTGLGPDRLAIERADRDRFEGDAINDDKRGSLSSSRETIFRPL